MDRMTGYVSSSSSQRMTSSVSNSNRIRVPPRPFSDDWVNGNAEFPDRLLHVPEDVAEYLYRRRFLFLLDLQCLVPFGFFLALLIFQFVAVQLDQGRCSSFRCSWFFLRLGSLSRQQPVEGLRAEVVIHIHQAAVVLSFRALMRSESIRRIRPRRSNCDHFSRKAMSIWPAMLSPAVLTVTSGITNKGVVIGQDVLYQVRLLAAQAKDHTGHLVKTSAC